jgi:hypothetical protein
MILLLLTALLFVVLPLLRRAACTVLGPFMGMPSSASWYSRRHVRAVARRDAVCHAELDLMYGLQLDRRQRQFCHEMATGSRRIYTWQPRVNVSVGTSKSPRAPRISQGPPAGGDLFPERTAMFATRMRSRYGRSGKAGQPPIRRHPGIRLRS